jgi:hypothetical protein
MHSIGHYTWHYQMQIHTLSFIVIYIYIYVICIVHIITANHLELIQ